MKTKILKKHLSEFAYTDIDGGGNIEDIEKAMEEYANFKTKELNGYLEEINNLMWNTWGVKFNKFDREEGNKIMVILNKWAKNNP